MTQFTEDKLFYLEQTHKIVCHSYRSLIVIVSDIAIKFDLPFTDI